MLLKEFSFSRKEKRYRWSEIDGTPIDPSIRITDQLCELGLLVRVENWLEVDAIYEEMVTTVVNEKKVGVKKNI